MHWVEKWLSKLLSVIKPYLYANGGPVVMVQVGLPRYLNVNLWFLSSSICDLSTSFNVLGADIIIENCVKCLHIF